MAALRVREQTSSERPANGLTGEYKASMQTLGSRMNGLYKDSQGTYVNFGHLVYSENDMHRLMTKTLTTQKGSEGSEAELFQKAESAPLSTSQAYAAIVLSHPAAIKAATNEGRSHIWNIYGPGNAGKTEMARTSTMAFNNMLVYSKLAMDRGESDREISSNIAKSAEQVFSPLFKSMGMDIDYEQWGKDFHDSAKTLFSFNTDKALKLPSFNYDPSWRELRGNLPSQDKAPTLKDSGDLEIRNAYPPGSGYMDDQLSLSNKHDTQPLTQAINPMGEKGASFRTPTVIQNHNIDPRMLEAKQKQIGRREEAVEGPFGRQGIGVRIGPSDGSPGNYCEIKEKDDVLDNVLNTKNQFALASTTLNALDENNMRAQTSLETLVGGSGDQMTARQNIMKLQSHMTKMNDFIGGGDTLKNTFEGLAKDDATSLNSRLSHFRFEGNNTPGGQSSFPPEAASVLHSNMFGSMMNHLESQGHISQELLDRGDENPGSLAGDEKQEYERQDSLVNKHLSTLKDMVDVFSSHMDNVSRTTGIILKTGGPPQPTATRKQMKQFSKDPANDLSRTYQRPPEEVAASANEGANARLNSVRDRIYQESQNLGSSQIGEVIKDPDAVLALKNRISPNFEKTGYGEHGIAEQSNNAQLCSMKKVVESGDLSMAKMPEEGGEHAVIETGRIRGNRTLSQTIEVADSLMKYIKGDDETKKGWARDFLFGAYRATPMSHLLMKSMDLYGSSGQKMSGFDQFFGSEDHKISGFENFSDDDFGNAAKLMNSYGESQQGALTRDELHGQVLNSLDKLVTPDEKNNELQNNALGNFEKLMTMVASPEHRGRLMEGLDEHGTKIMGAMASLRRDDFSYNAPNEEHTKEMQNTLKKKFCPENDGAPQNLSNALSKASSEAMPDHVASSSNYASTLNNIRINRGLTGLV